jgi:hypothetical protein
MLRVKAISETALKHYGPGYLVAGIVIAAVLLLAKWIFGL